MAYRHELSEAEWMRIAPLLPPRETRGTYCRDHRTLLNGMLHWHATGIPWVGMIRLLLKRLAPLSDEP